MTEKNITTKVQVFAYTELTEEDKKLVDMARQATGASYAPYSNYHVGAALVLDNGEYFIGANQENAAFAGICGERSAIYAAGARFPGVPVRKLAITAAQNGQIVAEPVAPCGVCRQAILEFEKNAPHPIEILLAGRDTVYRLESIASTLPLCFKEF
ncbi:MAG: cytidine deaminase [Muribaculaceae bacterium]|nr:cytidine deaminase [Muribaculaceae bacterium]MBR1726233.1 cytidine deaminase [Muribaculaceae bacterium]